MQGQVVRIPAVKRFLLSATRPVRTFGRTNEKCRLHRRHPFPVLPGYADAKRAFCGNMKLRAAASISVLKVYLLLSASTRAAAGRALINTVLSAGLLIGGRPHSLAGPRAGIATEPVVAADEYDRDHASTL